MAEQWRPPEADVWWAPTASQFVTDDTDAFDPQPVGTMPALRAGEHRLVMSLLGSDDTPSYAPDGSRAYDLQGGCSLDVVVEPGVDVDVVVVRVTFTPGPDFRASCEIEREP